MPDTDPVTFDFQFPASPGDNWPAIMGVVDEEEAPALGGGISGTTGGTASYELVYAWQVD